MDKTLSATLLRLTISYFLLSIFGILQGQTTFLNRPSKTESATVLDQGIIQIEGTYELELSGATDELEKEILFPGVLLGYGLGWGIELRLSNRYETYKDKYISASGFADIDIGAKIKLLKGNDDENEVALISHFFIPTGSTGISNKRIGNESLILVWQQVSEKIGIEYNIGYSNFEFDSEIGNLIYSFVTDYEINDHFGFFIETYGELLEFEELEASFDLGLAYQLSDYLEFELATGTGLNHKMLFALIGLSWRIGEREE